MNLTETLELTSDVFPEPSAAKTFLDRLEVEWIERALRETGVATVRRRRLPAEQIVWLVVAMSLMRNRSITDIVDKYAIALPSQRGSVVSSAVTQARHRLGPEPIEWLFRHAAQVWGAQSMSRYAWRGLRLLGADGTKLSVPDSEGNRASFDKHTGGNGTSGYPMLRLVALMALESKLCLDAEMGSFASSELELATRLWKRVPDQSLTILDRGFFYAPTLIPLAAGGSNRHWLTRARKNTRWTEIEQLGDGDFLVQMEVEARTRKKSPDLPRTWTMRAIHWRDAKDGRPKYLVTSLLDAERYAADDIRQLYVERWEQEIAYDDLKTSQLAGRPVLRSRTPDGVRQELWGILLGHNLLRVEMEAVAVRAKVSPRRVSFLQALRLIVDEWLWLAVTRSPGAIPRHLAELRENLTRLILPERRTRPPQPRAVKPRPRKYRSKK